MPLFAANALALYLFLPLPLALLAGVIKRRPEVIAGCLIAAGVCVYFWGALFWPNARVSPEGPVLRVMTYNLLGYAGDPEAVLRTIRASNADVITLQELNPAVAGAIEANLAAGYPFQDLSPDAGVHGMGVISRLPMRPTAESIPDRAWVGPPHIEEIDFDGRVVTLVTFHAISHPGNYGPRDREARKLEAYARAHEGPLILAGDLNATDTNAAYGRIAAVLADSWREAGSGFGHTFPGASAKTSPGSSRPDIFGIAVPKWLVRIDFVFHSAHWRAVSARIGPFDGVSDHRPVIVELTLRD